MLLPLEGRDGRPKAAPFDPEAAVVAGGRMFEGATLAGREG